MRLKMYAVIEESNVLVGIFLIKEDAEQWVSTQGYLKDTYKVVSFEMEWNHWIEARKTLGVY